MRIFSLLRLLSSLLLFLRFIFIPFGGHFADGGLPMRRRFRVVGLAPAARRPFVCFLPFTACRCNLAYST